MDSAVVLFVCILKKSSYRKYRPCGIEIYACLSAYLIKNILIFIMQIIRLAGSFSAEKQKTHNCRLLSYFPILHMFHKLSKHLVKSFVLKSN